jgi:hypothetical protein
MPNKRWMATIKYRDGTKSLFIEFEKITDLHDSVERDPNRNSIEQIVVTLNLSSAQPRHAEIESEN